MSIQSRTYKLSFLYKIKITDEEIVGSYDFRSHRLAWHEITSVSPNSKGQGLILSNAGEDTSIYINPNVPKYFELVENIQKRRPDLWGKQDIQTFHYSLLPPVYLCLSSIALIFYVFNPGHANPNWFISLIGIIIGLFLIGYAMACRLKLFFDGDRIIIKHVALKTQIQAGEINAILTEKPLIIRIGKRPLFYINLLNSISLELHNGKTILLGNVREDRSILLNSLQKWARTYMLMVA